MTPNKLGFITVRHPQQLNLTISELWNVDRLQMKAVIVAGLRSGVNCEKVVHVVGKIRDVEHGNCGRRKSSLRAATSADNMNAVLQH